MAEILIQEKKSGLAGAFFKPDTFSPKKVQIKILETKIASELFEYDEDEDIQAFKDAYKPGTELTLFRDINNKSDKWSIEVANNQGEVIGYISCFKNETVARLMDAGKSLTAIILDENQTDNGDQTAPDEKGIPIGIFMDE